MKKECCSRILDTGSYVMEGKCFSSRDKLHYKPKYSDKEYQNKFNIIFYGRIKLEQQKY